MSLWLKAHADPWALVLVALGAMVIALIGANPMPILRLGFGNAPFVVLVPAIIASALVALMQRGLPTFEAVSSRRTPVYLIGGVAVVVAITGLLWLATGSRSGAGMGFRNLCGYIGVSLILLRLLGGIAAKAFAPAVAVAVSVLGSTDSLLWWPMFDAGDRGAMAIAIGLFVIGLVVGSSRDCMRLKMSDG